MKLIKSLAVGLAAAALILALWYFGGDVGRRRPRAEPPSVAETRGREAGAVTHREARPPFDPTAYLPGWVAGQGMPTPTDGRRPGDHLPRAAWELAGLCFGKTKATSNTPAVKRKIQELITAELTAEEVAALAAFFEESDDPALKFQLLIAFRYMDHDELIGAAARYYDADPDAVGECLQWMARRNPAAVEAFADILQREQEPRRREKILERVVLSESQAAVPLLLDRFDAGAGSVDRRIAVQGLARFGGEAGRQRLLSLIEGEREEAWFDPGGQPPTDEALRDLRAHAVIGTLMFGDEADVRYLFDRWRTGDPEDPVNNYVKKYLAVVQDRQLVAPVVDQMVTKGDLDPDLLAYLEARATRDDYDSVARLAQLATEGARLRRLEALLARLR